MPADKNKNKALLILENKQVFEGTPFGFFKKETFGEVVFNTAMTGYQEALTDPSYYGQILTMTYPLVGNYGINKDDFESEKIQVRGFVISELCSEPSHYKSENSTKAKLSCAQRNFVPSRTLDEFLKEHKIPGICGVDTRALTQIIRQKGTMKGILCKADVNIEEIAKEINEKPYPDSEDLLTFVTRKSAKIWNSRGAHNVVVIDAGVKLNIIRSLLKRNCKVTVVPAHTGFDKVLSYKPDGILISNGPGDPAKPSYAIETVRKLINETEIPLFGICLGNQILALAAGAKTYKLKFGHRGVNHPVKDLETGKAHITTQNHGYAVDAKSLEGTGFKVSHINLNDNSVEGISHKEKKIFAVQYHPEGCPGPQDNQYLFDRFLENVKGGKNAKA